MTTAARQEPFSESNYPAISLGPTEPFSELPLSHLLERRWLNYTFLSRSHDFGMVANLCWLGADPDKPDASGHTALLLLYHRGEGWRSSQFNAAALSPPWSSFRLPHPLRQPGRFEIASTLGTPAVRLRLQRSGYPGNRHCVSLRSQQHVRWQAEPGIIANGDWQFGDRLYPNLEAIGYHERVYGCWSWAELGSWVSGLITPTHSHSAVPPLPTVLFNLMQPAQAPEATTSSVMLWQGGHLRRCFPRRNVRIAVRGSLDQDQIHLVPAIARLLGVSPGPSVPYQLMLVARMGGDQVQIDFCAESAARILVPCEVSRTLFNVHEVIGSCHLEGQISGKTFAYQTYALIRFAGGTRDH